MSAKSLERIHTAPVYQLYCCIPLLGMQYSVQYGPAFSELMVRVVGARHSYLLGKMVPVESSAVGYGGGG